MRQSTRDGEAPVPVKTIFDLDEDVRASFLAGYDMTEHEVLSLSEAALRATAAEQPVTEAFYDALRLRRAMVAVYSADTQTEYAMDKESYDHLARRINDTYGDIVLTTTDATGGVLGLRGHRISPHGSVTSGSRHGVTRTVNVAAEIAEEDRNMRERRQLSQPHKDRTSP